MNDLTTISPEAAPYIKAAAEAVAEAESTIGRVVWLAGQALKFAADHCPRGQWPEYCKAIGVSETRARQYRQVYERNPDGDALLGLGKEVLIMLSAPSVPDEVRDEIRERVEAGEHVKVNDVRDARETAKAADPVAVDHDVDRTKLAPEERENKLAKAIAGIVKAVEKTKGFCEGRADWELLDQTLMTLIEDVKNS